jgi:hypothetical protein
LTRLFGTRAVKIVAPLAFGLTVVAGAGFARLYYLSHIVMGNPPG